jgi:hypothetical protein
MQSFKIPLIPERERGKWAAKSLSVVFHNPK